MCGGDGGGLIHPKPSATVFECLTDGARFCVCGSGVCLFIVLIYFQFSSFFVTLVTFIRDLKVFHFFIFILLSVAFRSVWENLCEFLAKLVISTFTL